MSPPRLQRGQATIDYTTLLAVVVALLAASAALVPGGARGVANAVRAQTEHALCIVTGKVCKLDRPGPCAVAMRRETRSHGVNIAIIKLGKEHIVLRELLSDGTVRITVIDRGSAGAEGGFGGRVQIDQDLNSGGLKREAKFGASGVQGAGKVYYAPNAQAGDRILRAIKDGDEVPVPPRDVFVQGGLRGIVSLANGGPMAGLDFDWTSTRLLTVRRNRESGELMISFSMGDGGSALAAAVVGGPTGSFDATTTFGLTLDRHNRPSELSLLAIGNVAAGAKLSKALAAPLALNGNQNAPANLVGKRWEFSARVDLTDDEVAAAWKRFKGSPTSLAAIRGLARALRERARLDVRTYRARSAANGTALGIAIGLKFGGETEHAIDRFNLLAASSRPPGGLWEPRFDCV